MNEASNQWPLLIGIVLAATLITTAFFLFVDVIEWLMRSRTQRRQRRLQELNPDLIKKN